MSVTGPAQSAVDWVNPVNWGPWGPLAGALGWPQACHVGGRRRSNAGDQNARRRAREGRGFHPQWVCGGGAGRVRRGSTSRVQRRWSEGLERPGTTATSSPAARCYGCPTEATLERANGQAYGLGGIYVRRGVQRA